MPSNVMESFPRSATPGLNIAHRDRADADAIEADQREAGNPVGRADALREIGGLESHARAFCILECQCNHGGPGIDYMTLAARPLISALA